MTGGGKDGSASRRQEGCPGCQLDEANRMSTGIPYLNFFYIWMACLANSLPIPSTFPYLYFMIKDMKIAKEAQDIGFYAGFVAASFFLARTLGSMLWGMFADKYGRKPCIMISILSVIVFNTLFGLSTSYWMAIVTRGLLGLLCGIPGPIKAYAIEVSRKEHQALGISILASSDAIAFVVGPAIGGFLAQPAEKYPNLFSERSIFGRFPYFLPSFVITILAMVSCIACIWLPETLHFHNGEKVESIEEAEAQVGKLATQAERAIQSSDTAKNSLLKNRQLMSAVILNGVFSLYGVAYMEIFSLWAVSSKQLRGLNLTSQEVGTVLAISGCGLLLYQIFVYPSIVKHFGSIRPLRPAVVLSILLLTTYPFMANLQGLELRVLITIASLLTVVFYATILIPCDILQNTAVTQEQRGVANGISVTLMSLFNSVAPAAAGILFSWAQKHMTGLFLPGDQIMFLMINMVSMLGLVLTFKPFFSMSNALRCS